MHNCAMFHLVNCVCSRFHQCFTLTNIQISAQHSRENPHRKPTTRKANKVEYQHHAFGAAHVTKPPEYSYSLVLYVVLFTDSQVSIESRCFAKCNYLQAQKRMRKPQSARPNDSECYNCARGDNLHDSTSTRSRKGLAEFDKIKTTAFTQGADGIFIQLHSSRARGQRASKRSKSRAVAIVRTV